MSKELEMLKKAYDFIKNEAEQKMRNGANRAVVDYYDDFADEIKKVIQNPSPPKSAEEEMPYEEKLKKHSKFILFMEQMYGIGIEEWENTMTPLHYLDAMQEYAEWYTTQPNQEKGEEWISVKDRLPNNSEKVLFYCFDGKSDNILLGYYVEDCGFWCYKTEEWEIYTTHWMPLPEPPINHPYK